MKYDLATILLTTLLTMVVGCGDGNRLSPETAAKQESSAAIGVGKRFEPEVSINSQGFPDPTDDEIFVLTVVKTNSEIGFDLYEGAESDTTNRILGDTVSELKNRVAERLNDALELDEKINSVVIQAAGDVLAGQVEIIKDMIRSSDRGAFLTLFVSVAEEDEPESADESR